MIRYGILGFGHHGVRRLAPAFANTQRSVLAGIWRRDTEKAQQNARHFGFSHIFTTPEQLCSSPDVDAVFVASPDAMHFEHTMLAFRHGKPVLCEKPLAMHSEQAEQMLDTARQANLAFGVAQNFRYNRSLEFMRDKIREGSIGKPVLATAQFCFESEKSPRTWIYDGSLACGGPIGDVGIHAIDALRFLLGQDVIAVTALARKDELSGDVEASAALALELSGGILASVQVSFRARYRTLVEVIGSTGVLRAESGFTVDHPVEIVHLVSGAVQSIETVSNADSYSRMLDAFSGAVEGQGTYAAPGEDALNNQRVLDAAFRSWHSGQRQSVSLA
jgi:predicted dehydrogenase